MGGGQQQKVIVMLVWAPLVYNNISHELSNELDTIEPFACWHPGHLDYVNGDTLVGQLP